MGTIERLIKNTGAMIIARGAQPLLNFFLIVIISRIVGAQGLGEYTTIFALLMIFQLISGFGMRMLLTREIAKYPDQVNKYLINSIIIVFMISVISTLAMLVTIFVLYHGSNITLPATVLSISLIASALIECFTGVLAGFERLKIVALITILEVFLKVLISIIVLSLNYGILAITIVFVSLRFLSALLLFLHIKKYFNIVIIKASIQFCISLVKEARYFALSLIFFSIYMQLDIIILSKVGTIADVGIYGAAYKIFQSIIILIESYFVAFYPVLSKFFKEKQSKFEEACYSSGKYFLILLIPLMFTIIFFFDNAFIFIFKEDFVPSIPILKILICLIIPFSIGKIFTFALLASGNQKIDLGVNLIGVIIKFVLVLMFASKYGYLGAAIGVVLSGIFLSLLQLLAGQMIVRVKLNIIIKPLLKIVFSGIIMLVLILSIKPHSMLVAIIVSFLSYGGLLYLMKTISFQEKIIQQLVKRKAKMPILDS